MGLASSLVGISSKSLQQLSNLQTISYKHGGIKVLNCLYWLESDLAIRSAGSHSPLSS